ncbi:hypothetical protein BGZ51_001058 [Haplosporangium sp. Z 767]|nr:hypothetical protein BGZ50_003078 [Haplosporangium sp. Z 11]KAF9187774.1 hypothetical protein BGZ51_001058 [Haplosporangium sp. Z 767]
MASATRSSLYRRMNAGRMAKEIIKGIPAGLVISLNAWAVSAWLKATILINSQPRWLFRKKRWSEGEMRAISCYYLVVAYLMLRVVRLASTLTKRPGRPYGDFFRNARPILGQVAIFSIMTMIMDEFSMFYILRKFGLEKRRILITGRPLDKDVEANDDDCCICYGAMLDDDDQEEYYIDREGGETRRGLSKDTDHVLENFCVVKQHVAHRGCIRKWYNYGPKGYRPLEAFRIFNWGTTLHGAVAGLNAPRHMGNRVGLGWLLSLNNAHTRIRTRAEGNVPLRVPLGPTTADTDTVGPVETVTTTATGTAITTNIVPDVTEHDHTHAAEPQSAQQSDEQQQLPPPQQQQLPPLQQQQQAQEDATAAIDAAEPVLRPLFPQQDEYNLARNACRKTCPACRQQLVLNFVDLAKGRQEMGYVQKLTELGRDMTKFSDWRGLILRSLITAGWVGVTIVGGKFRILAMDKAIARHQKNRALATMSVLSEPSPAFDPDCITSDGTSLYAISRIYLSGRINVRTIALAKSNANAPSILDLTWHVVSTVPQSNHYILNGLASTSSFNCYIDPKGVFTILSTASKSFAGDQTRDRQRGYQYNPADGGRWSNVDVTDDYEWNIVNGGNIFSVPNGESQVLMQVYRTNITVDTITLAMFNAASMTFEQQNRTWALPDASGTPYHFVAGNNNLYALSNAMIRNSFLNILPLNPTASPPPLTSVKAIPVTIPCQISTGNRVRMWVSGSTYYLFCAVSWKSQLDVLDIHNPSVAPTIIGKLSRANVDKDAYCDSFILQQDSDRRYWLITSDGNTVAPAISTNATFGEPEAYLTLDPEAFFPLGPEGGPPTWAFVSRGVDTFGLILSGSNAGSWQEAPYKLTVAGLPSSDSGSDGGGSRGSTGGTRLLPTAGIIATILSTFIVLSIIGSFLLKRCYARIKARRVSASYLPPDTAQYPSPQHRQYPETQQQPMTETSPSFPRPPPPTYSNYEQQQQQGLQSQQPCPPYTPQSHEDMEAQSVWPPLPSYTATLASNSPQYTNARSQNPQL